MKKFKPFSSFRQQSDFLSDDSEELQHNFSQTSSSQSEEQDAYTDCLYKLTECEHQLDPHRSIGVIHARNSDNNMEVRGTAFLISPNLILTAAHNVYSHQYSKAYSHIKFHLAPFGVLYSNQGIAAEDWRYPQLFQSTKINNQKYDYALIKLSQKIEHAKENLYLLPLIQCQKCLLQNKNQSLSIFGYPFKKQLDNYQPLNKQGSIFKINQYGLRKSKEIISIEEGVMNYRLPTLQGQNGCPIILGDKCIGIHIRSSMGNSKQISQGTLFNKQIIQDLTLYAQNMQAIPFCLNKMDNCKHNSLILNKQILPLIKTIQIHPFENQLYHVKEELQNSQQIRHELIFTLKHLYLSDNKLKTIDLSNNLDLRTLWLDKNQFNSIDISKNQLLTYLNLQQNCLSFIDLSYNQKLTTLSLSKNRLSKVRFDKNINLKRLTLDNNLFEYIDLKRNQNLLVLSMSYNMIENINLKHLLFLQYLYLDHNKIKYIDIDNNIKLKRLFLQNNQIRSIDLKNNTDLGLLNLQYNNLKYLDVAYNINIQKISLRNNYHLKCINLSTNVNLTQIYLGINYRQIILDLTKDNRLLIQPRQLQLTFTSLTKYIQIQAINEYNRQFQSDLKKIIAEGVSDIIIPQKVKLLSSENTNLKCIDLDAKKQLRILNLAKNLLTKINLNQCPNLTQLNLSHNQLAQVDLSANTQLKCLNLSNNIFCQINLSENHLLMQVEINYNSLQRIKINNAKQLFRLSLIKNQLKQVDISKNCNLAILQLNGNELKEINIANNIYLQHLNLSNNYLQQIDLSNITKLTTLYLNDNKIWDIKLETNTQLTQLYMNGNRLSQINLFNNKQISVLSLNHNELVQIDLANNKQLIFLDISFNYIKQIDLSKNTKLQHLKLNNNFLYQLNLSNNTQIHSLQLSDNNLTSINTSFCTQLRVLQLSNNFLSEMKLFFNKNLSLPVQNFLLQKSNCYKTATIFFKDDQTQCQSFVKNIRQFLELDSFIVKKKLKEQKTENIVDSRWEIITIEK